MNTLLFATGNARKFAEASQYLAAMLPNLRLEQLDADSPEIQTEVTEELMTAKAAEVRVLTARPFIIDDVSSVLEGTVNFPGALSKQVLRGLGPAALERVFAEGLKLTVACTIALSYMDELRFFTGSVTGTIRHGQRPLNKMPLNAIVYLEDQGMFLGDAGAVTHRSKAFEALAAFLQEVEAGDAREQEATSARWSERAADWSALALAPYSYTNHEDGYARFDRVLAAIMKSVEGPECLDVGCGSGLVTANLLELGASSVLGIDASSGMIEAARTTTADAKVTFRTATITDLPPDAAFDVIASRGVVVSHLPKHRVIDHLEVLTRVSLPGSYLVIDFINDLANGGFANVGSKNALSYAWLVRLMRELGWVPIARDGGDEARVIVAAFHRPFPDSCYFVSGNPHKVLEFRTAAGVPHLHGCNFDLPELKLESIEAIAEDKARQAHEIVGRPVVSTDGGIFLNAFSGFPGPNSKQAATLLKPQGLLKLLEGSADRSGYRRNAIAWFDGQTMRSHVEEMPITIASELRGTYPSYPLDRILIAASPRNVGGLTYAEMPPEERVALTELSGLAAFLRTCL